MSTGFALRVPAPVLAPLALLVTLAAPAGAAEPPQASQRAALLPVMTDHLTDLESADPPAPPAGAAVPSPAGPRPPVLVPLYASLAGLQVLDVHSTLRALGRGAYEVNPFMRGIAENPAGAMLVKAAGTAVGIYGVEQLRKKSPRAAVVTMIVVNAAMAAVVAHNYRVGSAR